MLSFRSNSVEQYTMEGLNASFIYDPREHLITKQHGHNFNVEILSLNLPTRNMNYGSSLLFTEYVLGTVASLPVLINIHLK